MKLRRSNFLSGMIAVAIAIIAFSSNSFAQLSVTITGTLTSPSPVPSPSPTPIALPATLQAPSGQFTINAQVTTGFSALTRVIFYRNDVPQQTFTGTNPAPSINEGDLGQDTYTYRARAYDASGNWVDSNELKLTVETPRVFKMGVGMVSPSPYPFPTPGASPAPTPMPMPTTEGPGSDRDHTDDIEDAIAYLDYLGGGTLFFPCSGAKNKNNIPELTSVYNIRRTINIPSNITLQSESSEEGGFFCQFKWKDAEPLTSPSPAPTPEPSDVCQNSPIPLRNQPMFKILSGAKHVRIRDMWVLSGIGETWPRDDIGCIEAENNRAVEINDENGESISDVVLENVSISYFKYGIKAIGDSISDIKVRGVRTRLNTRNLYINAELAYDWDVQNFDMVMTKDQGAVEIIRAGAPPLTHDAKKNIKFLQLNCAGDKRPDYKPAFCIRVEKHGGLFVKQVHTEGTDEAIIVENMTSETSSSLIVNDQPIVFEHSVATGEFNNESMKLYLIGNTLFAAPKIPASNMDQGRLRFYEDGVSSTVVDCGDVHYDWTDINDPTFTDWPDLKMLYTHSERNRESFFAFKGASEFFKTHTNCPSGVSGSPNINEVGGDYFNTGVLPSDLSNHNSQVYHWRLDEDSCKSPCVDAAAKINSWFTAGAATIFVNGTFDVNDSIKIPSGRQLIGSSTAELKLTVASKPLILIEVPIQSSAVERITAVAVRNLKLSTTQATTTGIVVIGNDCIYTPATVPPTVPPVPPNCTTGAASQINFNDLTIQGFTKGVEIRRFDAAGTKNPMFDSSSFKNLTFVNNQKAVEANSDNLSNLNVMNLRMQSNSAGAIGWHEKTAGVSMQNVGCQGTSDYLMEDCLKMELSAIYLSGFKQPKYVRNALTFDENDTVDVETPALTQRRFANSILRENDFTLSSVDEGITDSPNRSRINIIGKSFITTMNNKYSNFIVPSSVHLGKLSRVTYCGDRYANSPYPGLEPFDMYLGTTPTYTDRNYYNDVPMPTRVGCGLRPKPWETVVNWGGEQKPLPSPSATPEYYENDVPLVGNFFDDVREDMVIYREGAQSKFLIKKVGGYTPNDSMTVDWGTTGDIPLIGNFFANSTDQIVVFRRSNGSWWVKNPITTATAGWYFGGGSLATGDIPFVGNFFDDVYGTADGLDEVGYYRPSDDMFYIYNPRTSETRTISGDDNYGIQIQVGDFRGLGHDQIAQFNNQIGSAYAGYWRIVSADPIVSAHTESFGSAGDVPVAGKFLTDSCDQLGVWHPATEQFIVKSATVCSVSSQVMMEMYWGSNNNLGGNDYPDDIPLKINTSDGSLDRPVAYRPTKGAFPFSLANGQWWIHDPF